MTWPGILVFCHHLGSCFAELREPYFVRFWKIIGRDSPATVTDCWHWCFAVIRIFHTLDDNASIEKAYTALVTEAREQSLEINPQEKQYVLQAIFAILCWTSALLKPVLGSESGSSDAETIRLGAGHSHCSTAENTNRKYICKDLRRPVSKMFYAFRHQTQDSEEASQQSSGIATLEGGRGGDDVLYEASLNYFSLYTVGRLRVKWVNTLTEHLAYNRSRREISIFRFPSFCVANVLRETDVKVLQR